MDILGLLGFPSTERRRRRVLRRGVGPHARLGVGGTVHAGSLAAERRRRRGLLSGARTVVATATAAAVALAGHDRALSLPGATEREAEAARAERERLANPVDIHRPAVDERWVAAVEIVLLAFEWTFWFATWSAEIDRRLPWYDTARIAAALLALVTPVLGVAGARLGGAMAHRVLRGYDGVSRFERIGAWSGLSLAAASVVTIVWLAYWRFTEGAGIGAVHVPAVAMSLVFGLVVVLDALLRTFGVSEWHRNRVRRDRAVAADRDRADRADADVLHADERARAAWYSLRTRVQDAIAAAELVGITGDTLITDAVVVAGLDEAPATAGHPAAAHPPERDTGTAPGRALPSADRQRMLAGGHHVPFPLRHVADAIDVLAGHPPAGVGDSAEVVEDLRRRLSGATHTADRPTVVPLPRLATGRRRRIAGGRS